MHASACRRALVCAASALVIWALLSLCAPGPSVPSSGSAANIVFVLTDDLTADLIRFMPTVQRMRREGATFTNFFVADSLCCISRASILTGEYPHNTRVWRNSMPTGGAYAFRHYGAEKRAVAIALQHAGYRTGLFGKYLNGYSTYRRVPPGWTDWLAGYHGYDEFDYWMSDDGRPRFYGHRPQDYLGDVIRGRGLDFIDEAADAHKPFFAMFSTFSPHKPAVPAPRHRNLYPGLALPRDPAYDRQPEHAPPWLAGYHPITGAAARSMRIEYRHRAQSVRAIDELIATVWQRIEDRGLASNTYPVFTSDNGYHMGQHRLLAGKRTAFDTDVHVPLIVVGPGIAPGARVTALSANIDLAPTFRAMAGLGPDPRADGRSLLGVAEGEPTPTGWRQSLLLEHWREVWAGDDPDLQLRAAGRVPGYRALRGITRTYVHYKSGGRELYDQAGDPYQLDNAAGTLTRAQETRLDRAIARYRRCRGTVACERAGQVLPPAGDNRGARSER